MEKGKFISEELNMEATELRLGLPGSTQSISTEKPTTKIGNKRPFPDETSDRNDENVSETAPAPKAQIVGWPPIRSYRMNHFQASKKKEAEAASGMFIKVSMDGAPYLRKIDLKMYTDYQDLLKALEKMFSCFTMGVGKGSEYVSTYEDKDGDWMLVGDVPWEMFITSCKKLRIMKGSEAKGLSCCESSA